MHAYLWNIESYNETISSPLMEYNSEVSLHNISWCNTYNDWIGITKRNSFNMLRII
jgi:hypothetical protein